MGNFKEKVAYLHGLRKGLDINERSAESKLLIGIIDALDDMSDEFDNMNISQQDLVNYVEALDEDLSHLEEELYEDVDVCNEELSGDTYLDIGTTSSDISLRNGFNPGI